MALTTTHHHAVSFPVNILETIGQFLMKIAENSPTAKRLQRLNKMSDAELAERGMTRESATQELFRGRLYI